MMATGNIRPAGSFAGAMLAGLLCLAAADARGERFLDDCRALTAAPHRLTGTEEGRAAGDYIRGRLEEAGVDRVLVQPFAVPQWRVEQCSLTMDGEAGALSLHPLRANGIVPPVTPPEGLAGPVVHAGNGSAAAVAGKNLRGSIVVMDYDCEEAWLHVFRQGAAAVVFVRAGPARAQQRLHVLANANLPRFFYDGAASDLTEGGRATIHSRIVWENSVGRNIVGWVRGSAPEFGQDAEEALVLAVPYDSFGEVPGRSPGARGAANCAALLRLAGRLSAQRPRRHVLLLFLDGQARYHAGARALVRALEPVDSAAGLPARQGWYRSEVEFLDEMERLLALAHPFRESSDARRSLLQSLSTRAKEQATLVADAMYRLREEKRDLRNREGDGAKAGEAVRDRLTRIDTLLAETWQPQRDAWSNVQRALGRSRQGRARDETGSLSAAEQALLDGIVQDQRAEIDARRAELAITGRNLAADAEIQELLGKRAIVLYASLLLGDRSPAWGLAIGGDSGLHSENDHPGLYGQIQAVFLEAFQRLAAADAAASGFVRQSADQSLDRTRMMWGAPYMVHGGEVAGLLGVYNVALVTCGENMEREGTPDDVLEALDIARLRAQADDIGRLLFGGAGTHAVASQERLSLRRGVNPSAGYSLARFENGRVVGPRVMGALPGSAMPNQPVPGAMLQVFATPPASLTFQTAHPYAFENFMVLRTDQRGAYSLGPLAAQPSHLRNRLRAVTLAFDAQGVLASASGLNEEIGRVWYRMNTFYCQSGEQILPVQSETRRRSSGDILLMSARNNVNIDPARHFVEALDGVVGWFCDDREKGIKLFGLSRMVALNNGPATLASDRRETNEEALRQAAGTGFPQDADWRDIQPSVRSAADLWRLNDARIGLLRSRQIRDRSLAELHARSEDLLLGAAATTDPGRRTALAAGSFLSSAPVYRATRKTLDDLVFAVLLLLGLSVPFAFAMERVLVGARTIYRQIVWFGLFFLATFTLLYLAHPAFAVANTPMIIFLGFTIVVMSALVIGVIMRKFEAELRALQGLSSSAHSADVSRVTTFLAAMQMGISTMRRRPLRTALTATTVTLLTFTILCFASFATQLGIVRFFVGSSPSYEAVWIRSASWQPISRDFAVMLRDRWNAAVVAERYWLSPRNEERAGVLLTREDGTRPLALRGVLGLDPREIGRRKDLAEIFDTNLVGRVLLTDTVAHALGVREGDTVLAGGERLVVGRPFDPVKASVVVDMDDSSVLPVDFLAASSSSAQAAQSDESDMDETTADSNWSNLSPDFVLVVDTATARRLGAALQAVTMYAEGEAQAAEMADDIARMATFPVAVTLRNGVYRQRLGVMLAASGAKDLFFPILLGGLVVFGTMLASVADREREIYTFSSLGLAPRHVASLFFSEATVYAVIGGMGGYLIAQAMLKILTILSDHGLARVPEMNMSSTNTIVTILIVMATVLVSAVYPGIKASRSANPGLMRSWRLPELRGDELEFVFPFTVSQYDITGVVSFLREHFQNHADTGMGRFMAEHLRITRSSEGELGFAADVMLAPFDLGVGQSFALTSIPSGIPGIDEVRLVLRRRSGQPRDWHRLNKAFMNDLRRQFLLWRSLPRETMDLYRQQTLQELGAMRTESVS
jgi:hypothetical protein